MAYNAMLFEKAKQDCNISMKMSRRQTEIIPLRKHGFHRWNSFDNLLSFVSSENIPISDTTRRLLERMDRDQIRGAKEAFEVYKENRASVVKTDDRCERFDDREEEEDDHSSQNDIRSAAASIDSAEHSTRKEEKAVQTEKYDPKTNALDFDSSSITLKAANTRSKTKPNHLSCSSRANKSVSLSPGFRPKESINFSRIVSNNPLPRMSSHSAPNTPQRQAKHVDATGGLLEMLSQSFTSMKNLMNPEDHRGDGARSLSPPGPDKTVDGGAYFRRGMRKVKKSLYPEAVKYFNFALERQREDLGEDHLDCATTLNEIGKTLMMMGERYPALNAFEEALYIRQKLFGAGAKEVAEVTNNIWMVLHEQRCEMENERDK